MIGSPCIVWSNTRFDRERRRMLVNCLSVFIYPGRERICGFVYNKTFIIYRGRRKAKQKFYECRFGAYGCRHRSRLNAHIGCLCLFWWRSYMTQYADENTRNTKSTWARNKQLTASINTESERIWRVNGEKRPLNWNETLTRCDKWESHGWQVHFPLEEAIRNSSC